MSHWPVFVIDYDAPVNVDDALADAQKVESVITLCADQVTVTRQLLLRSPAAKIRMMSGEYLDKFADIEYLAPQVGFKSSMEKRRRRHPHQMLLSFDELGGVDRLGKWLDLTDRFGRALNSMLSVKRASSMFSQNRFLNVAFAAEAYHRDMYGRGESIPAEEFATLNRACIEAAPQQHRTWLEQRLDYANDTSFRQRIRKLTELAGPPMAHIVGNLRIWVDTIAQIRNRLTHLDSTAEELDASALYFLSESLFAMVRLCMLREVGAPDEVLNAKSTSYELSWYRERLQTSIGYCREKL